MIQKYCMDCGQALIEKKCGNEGMVPYCPACEQFRFPMYNVAVSMIVVNEETDKILLIQQYGRTRNILVAGYVNRGEKLEEAVVREIKEETGMDVNRIQFNRTSFYEPSNTLMCNFTAFVQNDLQLNPNEEVDRYAWFTAEEAKENIALNSLASRFLCMYLDEEKGNK